MTRHALSLPALAALAACAMSACARLPPEGYTPYSPSPAIATILSEREAMHAQEMAGMNIDRAREVPSLIDAAQAVPNVAGLPSPGIEVQRFNPLTASGAEGPLTARLYRPQLAKNTPVILYFGGGTWATGTLDMYDNSARQLAVRTGWVVVSLRARRAPEATFPMVHDDAMALYQWARGHLREWGADPTQVVLAGEGPGANLALSTALLARDQATHGGAVPTPDALLLITPLAGTSLRGASMDENGDSRPLSRRTLRWAQNLYAPDNLGDPRIDLASRQDFTQMPQTTIILAEMDPLRSGGEELAARLQASGVPVESRVFPGTTADFFGLGQQVPDAAAAEDYAANRLRQGFVGRTVSYAPAPRR